MRLLEKLKTRWGIESNTQVAIIFFVFSVAGFAIVYVRKLVFSLLGIEAQDPFWLKTIVWLLTIFPLYNVSLLIFGTLLGQFEFFWWFFKKALFRFIPGKSV